MLKNIIQNFSLWYALYCDQKKQAHRHFRLGDLLVVYGLITRQQLRHALKKQKQTGKRLGAQLIDDNAITVFTLQRFLFQQKVNRFASLAFGAFLGSLVVLITPSAQADPVDKIMVVASVDLNYDASAGQLKQTRYPRLFNKRETRHSDISAFTKWSGMFDRLEKQMDTGQHDRLLQEWKKELSTLIDLSMEQKIEKVNAYINQTKFISDSRNWGTGDYWATPIEFFTRGGDCEDFAIAKMLSLKALGISEKQMRITIVQDLEKNIPHAVLIVYGDDGRMYVMDNQDQEVKSTSAVSRYKPIFSLSRDAWWRYSS